MKDLYICDHAGECESPKDHWCSKPFDPMDRTNVGCANEMSCLEWVNMHPCCNNYPYGKVKAIPYKEKEEKVEDKYATKYEGRASLQEIREKVSTPCEIKTFASLAQKALAEGFNWHQKIEADKLMGYCQDFEDEGQWLINQQFVKVVEPKKDLVFTMKEKDDRFLVECEGKCVVSFLKDGSGIYRYISASHNYNFKTSDDGRIWVIK